MRIYRAINKALAALLMLSIIGVGVFAVNLSHISYSVTYRFGDQTTASEIQLADAMPPSNIPLPHKRIK